MSILSQHQHALSRRHQRRGETRKGCSRGTFNFLVSALDRKEKIGKDPKDPGGIIKNTVLTDRAN